MGKNPEMLIRGVLAALIGSKLTVAELRLLGDLLEHDRGFRRELSSLLTELSFGLGPQVGFDWQEPVQSEPNDAKYSGLTDLAYNVVQRRRISKAKLLSLFSASGISAKEVGGGDMSVREMVHRFLELASPKQLNEFMDYLGLDVEQDAYLGVIGRSRS